MQRRRVRLSAGLAGNGVVLAVHWVTFFEAIRVSSVAIGLLGYATFPLFVLVARARHARPAGDRRASGSQRSSSSPASSSWSRRSTSPTARSGDWPGVWCRGSRSRCSRSAAARSPRRTHRRRSRSWQNVFAALALLPFVWLVRDALTSIAAARHRAAARSRHRLHGARAHAVHREPAPRHRAHGERRGRARAGLRHRARGAAAERGPDAAHACRRRADRRRRVCIATRRACGV